MYVFHYNYVLNKYDKKNIRLTDTDSLFYEIKTEDVCKDLYEEENDKKEIDTSEYPVNNEYHSNENEKIIRKMKDETKGYPINEFIGPRSKM